MVMAGQCMYTCVAFRSGAQSRARRQAAVSAWRVGAWLCMVCKFGWGIFESDEFGCIFVRGADDVGICVVFDVPMRRTLAGGRGPRPPRPAGPDTGPVPFFKKKSI